MHKEMVERVARAICAADKTAPDPDAPIQIGLKSAKAWEGRIEMAEASLKEARKWTPAADVKASYIGLVMLEGAAMPCIGCRELLIPKNPGDPIDGEWLRITGLGTDDEPLGEEKMQGKPKWFYPLNFSEETDNG